MKLVSTLFATPLLSYPMLSGCDGGASVRFLTDPGSGSPVSSPADQSADWNGPEGHGRFIGVVRIEDIDYFGDAILTEDGQLRLYVGERRALWTR